MKKVLVTVFSFMLIFSISTGAIATTLTELSQKGFNLIDKTNMEIEERIALGQADAAELLSDYLIEKEEVSNDVELTDEERAYILSKLEEEFEKNRDQLVAVVFKDTREMSKNAIDELKKLGIEAECYLEAYEFAGKEYLIDPIRVIGYSK